MFSDMRCHVATVSSRAHRCNRLERFLSSPSGNPSNVLVMNCYDNVVGTAREMIISTAVHSRTIPIEPRQ